MRLIVLHGPPASGKLSIAKALEELVGCKTFHNHVAIDVAKSFYEFDAPGFWEMVEAVRLTCLKSAAENFRGSVVYTWVYDHPKDLKFYEKVERVLEGTGVGILPVYLDTPIQELERRVVSAQRRAMGKVSSVEGLRENLKRWNCLAIPRASCISIATAGKTVEACAHELAEYVALGRLQSG